jgi:glycosyltransferase involved in cell wall biosynthesis
MSGGHLRAFNLIDALTDVGEIDLVFTQPMAPEVVARIEERWPEARVLDPVHTTIPGWLGHPRWLASTSLPSAIGFVDRRRLREAFSAWQRPPYDLALCISVEGLYALGDELPSAKILDLPDLMDVRAGRSRELRHETEARRGMRGLTRDWRLSTDERRWRAYQRAAANRVHSVTVCSEVDARHLGVPNAVVIPNGYELQGDPVGRQAVGVPPTFILPGMMRYGPNEDAAHYLIGSILPRLLRVQPDARIVLAGDASSGVRALARPPAVVVTGQVDSMERVLSTADAVVVPIRVGGGTRIKIIEAWAHGIPVVSTTVGAEGLDCRSGRELLIADSPDGFARACVDVVTDVRLRAELIAAGRRRAATLTWTLVRERFLELVRSVCRAS